MNGVMGMVIPCVEFGSLSFIGMFHSCGLHPTGFIQHQGMAD